MSDQARLSDSPVGRRRGATSGAPPIWFGIPFAVMGVIAFVLGFGMLQDELRFGREGAAVAGIVVAKTYDPGSGDEQPSHHLGYEFMDPATGQRHGGSGSISSEAFNSLRVGDAVQVTYLPAEPTTSRLGSPEPQPMIPFIVMGVGALFALVGPILILTSLRARRRPALSPTTDRADRASGPATAAELRRVDVFTRSPMRVLVDLVLGPIGGLGFLGVAAFGVTQIAVQPFWLFGAPLMAFFGLLLLSTIASALRQGVTLRLVEVGPDGIWTAGLGRLPWADLAEARLEANRGVGPTERNSGFRIGVGGLGTGSRWSSTTVTHHRLGLVPRDPALATRAPGRFARGLASGYVRLLNSVRRVDTLTVPSATAPFGVNAYEIEQPFDDLVASVRRFVSVSGAEAASSASPVAVEAAPVEPVAAAASTTDRLPMSDAELRALDARLGAPSAAPGVIRED